MRPVQKGWSAVLLPADYGDTDHLLQPGQQQKVVTVTPGAHNLLHLSLQHGQQDKQLLQLLCGTGDSLIVWQAAAAPTAAGPVHHISAQAVLLVHNSCSAVAYPHSVQADTNAQEQSKLWRPLCAALSGCGGICYAGIPTISAVNVCICNAALCWSRLSCACC